MTGLGTPGTGQVTSPSSAHGAASAAPVCDPRRPASFRRWARRQRPCLDSGGSLVALVPGGTSRGAEPAVITGWLLAAVCLVLLLAGVGPAGQWEWLAAAAAVAATAAVTAGHRARRRDRRLYRASVIYPEQLNRECRVLLGRVQQALAVIRGSRVRAAGLLVNPVDEALLDLNEWEIAGRLRAITSARTTLKASSPGRAAGPMTADVLAAQRRAIDVAQEATTARVRAVERYAEQVIAADEADRDWEQATAIAHLNDTYLDLVARTAADDQAAGEITRLAGRLAAARQARGDRLREADLAARALDLPEADGKREAG